MDDSELDRLDPSGMHRIYDRWPDIAREAHGSDVEPADFGDISHIVFSGMGGSGAVGDLFSSVLSETATHVTVVKGYMLPRTADKNTLVVCTSVSGDTAETLAVAESASRLGCKLVGFSSGGGLEKFCAENSVPFRKVRHYLNPRSSFPSYVYTMIRTLEPILPISDSDVSESLQRLDDMAKKIGSHNASEQNPAQSLARQLGGIPLAYYPWGLRAAAIRFKNSVQENMKSHAIIEDVIEACHNGIVSWERGADVMPVFIRGKDDHPRTKERWDILGEFFAKKGIKHAEVKSSGNSILSKIVGLTYQLDYTTIYGAALRGINPFPVEPIDFIKGRTQGRSF